MEIWVCGSGGTGMLFMNDYNDYATLQRTMCPIQIDQMCVGGVLGIICNEDGVFMWQNNTIDRLSPIINVKQLACGWNHALILADQFYGIGNNSFGQLGLGKIKQVDQLIQLSVQQVIYISTLFRSSYAITNQGIYATGDNRSYQLHTDNNQRQYQWVATNLPQLDKIASGKQHAIGYKQSQLIAWGSNTYGQLGVSDRSSNFMLHCFAAKNIHCGWFSSIVHTVQNEVFIAGRGDQGQQGTGERQNQYEFTKILDNVDRVAAGYEHCFAQISNSVYAWGWNEHGNLGVDHNDDILSPQVLNQSYSRVETGAGYTYLFQQGQTQLNFLQTRLQFKMIVNTGTLPLSNSVDLSNYSWPGVIQFLSEQCKQFELERTQWMLDKKQLNDKVNSLESEVKAQEMINQDLLNRTKMLEFSLRQERLKYSKLTGGHHRVNSDVISTVLAKVERSTDNQSHALPKRRSRAHRQLLSKYLQELGLDDIFATEYQQRQQAHHRPSKSFGQVALQSALTRTQQPHEIEQRLPMQPRHELNENAGQQTILHSQVKTEHSEGQTRPPLPKHQEARPVEISVRRNWDYKASLQSHMDSVRAIKFTDREGILVSAGEDCVLKLWDINQFQYFHENAQIEPYYTLRGHSKAIFSIEIFSSQEQLLYSSGASGDIMVWSLPSPRDVDPYGSIQDANYNIGVLQGHTDVVWSLSHHSIDNHLISSSADGSVRIWRTQDSSQAAEQSGRNVLKVLKSADNLIPTCAKWSTNPNTFVVAYNTPIIDLYDRNDAMSSNPKPTQIHLLNSHSGVDQQVNCLCSIPGTDLIACGHEDNHIRVVDLKSGLVVKDIIGHQDSVSSVAVDRQGTTIITGSHDGSVRFWDLRTYSCCQQLLGHRQKFDEGVNSVDISPNQSLGASGGTDGLVKLYVYTEDLV